MTLHEMKAAAEAKPFKPFRIRLADGETLNVQHPDYLLHSPGWRTVFVFSDAQAFRIVDTMLITALEFGQANGEARER